MQTAILDLPITMQLLQQSIVTGADLKRTREAIMICLHVCTPTSMFN